MNKLSVGIQEKTIFFQGTLDPFRWGCRADINSLSVKTIHEITRLTGFTEEESSVDWTRQGGPPGRGGTEQNNPG